MRVWSLHPQLLDRAALVSGWRETLLAQAVLAGRTKGYRAHPQLERWREADDPLQRLADYLHAMADEADARGYHFNRERIDRPRSQAAACLSVTSEQLAFEFAHLERKVAARDRDWWVRMRDAEPRAHPVFRVVPGPIERWERGAITAQ